MSKTSVAIIDKEEKNIDKVSYLLEKFSDVNVIRTSTSLDELKMLLERRVPCLVWLGPEYTLEDIEPLLKEYCSRLDVSRIILLARDISAELLKKALKLNVYDVLGIPFSPNDIKETMNRSESSVRTGGLVSRKAAPKRITIFGTKGGVGKSFLAVNLAVGIMAANKKRVSLVDTNYQFGDIALMLDLHPKYSIYDIVPVLEQLDPSVLESFLTTHSSGIKVLPAPVDISKSTGINVDVTMKILDNLSEISDYVVIDTSSYFSDDILNIFRDTDYLCIITSKDTPSIKNLKIALQLLDQLKFPRENIWIVLNRADSKVGITLEEIEETIQRKVDIAIPSNRIVPITVNKGIPVIMDVPRSPVTKSIKKLIKIITEAKRIDR